MPAPAGVTTPSRKLMLLQPHMIVLTPTPLPIHVICQGCLQLVQLCHCCQDPLIPMLCSHLVAVDALQGGAQVSGKGVEKPSTSPVSRCQGARALLLRAAMHCLTVSLQKTAKLTVAHTGTLPDTMHMQFGKHCVPGLTCMTISSMVVTSSCSLVQLAAPSHRLNLRMGPAACAPSSGLASVAATAGSRTAWVPVVAAGGAWHACAPVVAAGGA